MRNTSVPANLFNGTAALRPVPTGPAAQVITVTPDQAKEWLKVNTHNRSLRKGNAERYARDMTAGKWLMNGEAIKFGADGTLLDGQHRLTAVVLAGVAVDMLVITGLEGETQETMDAGAKRRTADAFGLRGEKNAAVLASVLKKVWMWQQGDHKFNGYVPTTPECSTLLEKHPEIHRSVEIAVRVHGTFRALPQSITGTAHFLFSQIAADDAVWFFARIGDGAALEPGHPILALRTRIFNEAQDRSPVTAHQRMGYLIRSWNAVREGRTLARIQQGPKDPMPTPK
jgi:hypothetical protein